MNKTNGSEIEPENGGPENTPVKIMFVDDNKACTMLVEKIFKFFKWYYMSFNDAGEALVVSKKERFDIIFSDMKMPGTDGFDFARSIRNNPANPNFETPIIIVSGSDTDDFTGHNRKTSGINEFIDKPYSIEQFNAMVNKYVLSQQQNQSI
ncbi:MAG TPA: hypothetical protein DC017_15470 [Candidatus Wallbacteria bacterium]|nr:hypothetical protein [Candidatus Wallbacteria bacterium]